MPAELLMLNVTFDFCPQSTILSCSEQFDGRLLIFFASFQAGKTLSARKWHAAFSPDGCLDIASVLSRIQRGVRFLIFWSYCFSVSYMLLVLQMSNYILSVMFTPINMIYLLLGCASNSQGEVWEFLLGCFDPRSTFDEREEIRQIRRYLLP